MMEIQENPKIVEVGLITEIVNINDIDVGTILKDPVIQRKIIRKDNGKITTVSRASLKSEYIDLTDFYLLDRDNCYKLIEWETIRFGKRHPGYDELNNELLESKM